METLSSDLKILIVDDTATDRLLLQTILETQGYQTFLTSGGLEAIAFLQQQIPDLILLDVQMPDLDGYSVCQILKQDPQFTDIPIIFISAASSVSDKVKAFQIGGLDYVTKPFHRDEMLARVQTHLSLRSLQTQLQLQNTQLSEALQQLRITQTQLVISEKMAVLGQLVASMAHEMNTPLSVIRSSAHTTAELLDKDFLDLITIFNQLSPVQQTGVMALIQKAVQSTAWILQASSRDRRSARRELIQQLEAAEISPALDLADLLVDSGIHQDLSPDLTLLNSSKALDICKILYGFTSIYRANQMTFSAVDRASTVVQALRRYAHVGDQTEAVETDLIESLETVLTLYHSQMRSKVEVIRDYEPVAKIWGFQDDLHQLWSNLIINALHAMEYQGKLHLSVKQLPDRQVEISIVDSGHGIPPEIQSHIFDPFFTTKAKGEGNGLGLSFVKNIVEQHQGTIELTSRPQETRFTIRLPEQRSR